ncbi:MAG: hypothetical protein ACLFVP_05870 [Candidatus Bathyarchaeia archaeon]
MNLVLQGPSSLLIGFIILLIIGSIIIAIAGTLIAFLPALIVAGIVWWITGNETFAGVAFLLIALLSLTKRK